MTTSNHNVYGRQLTRADIESKEHRSFVGGMWDEIGALQLAFLRSQGLKPAHDLLDVGCGALRGGIPLIRYLERGRYCGLDLNASLLEAGRRELAEAGLEGKEPRLAVSAEFEFSLFARQFDYALAHSLFTHLPMNHIVRCLVEARKAMKPNGVFFATYFEAPSSGHLAPITWTTEIISNYDTDPFHYSLEELRWTGSIAQMSAMAIGDWGHPRRQRMIAFRPRVDP